MEYQCKNPQHNEKSGYYRARTSYVEALKERWTPQNPTTEQLEGFEKARANHLYLELSEKPDEEIRGYIRAKLKFLWKDSGMVEMMDLTLDTNISSRIFSHLDLEDRKTIRFEVISRRMESLSRTRENLKQRLQSCESKQGKRVIQREIESIGKRMQALASLHRSSIQ